MRRATPPGAAKPWRTPENVEIVARLVEAGAAQDELEILVDGVAELIRRGIQSPAWWYPRNLFGPNVSRWRADVEAFRATQAAAQARELELATIEARSRAQAQEAAQAPLGIHSLEVHRLAQSVLGRLREDAEAAREDGDGEAAG